ncbi:MAG TPA: FliA/WhiG family RNA polymerase sigma factor [Jatrophihabitans sp.]|uniref:sigma-70 family RNA polymerase sigma factor n=1 Tax=Jatrophihabitans sp. TaxID=1932789 RepID=UPI002DFC16C1|nr:FliA/WhiG family RNA polymerase sigma factor [Jatrophihabitans sp.]
MTAATIATEVANDDALVESHIPLVGHLVRELMNRLPSHVNRDDLVSAGMLALVLSARSFDPERGVPFARFAAFRIRGALTDQLRTMDWASRAVRGKAREVESVRNTMAARLGRTPDKSEIASAMGVTVEDLDHVDADVQRASVLSLQGLTTDDDAGLLPSANEGPEGLLVRREQIGYLRDAVAELPERLRTVVEQYFFAERKMADIAAELGVTESRVSQLRSEALAYLRDGMRGHDSGELPARVEVPQQRKRATAAREAYTAAVASRSTLAHRLQATTALGETRVPVVLRAVSAG